MSTVPETAVPNRTVFMVTRVFCGYGSGSNIGGYGYSSELPVFWRFFTVLNRQVSRFSGDFLRFGSRTVRNRRFRHDFGSKILEPKLNHGSISDGFGSI